MSEMIPFPDKEAQLLASGTRKMLAQDYLSAKKDFEKLYNFAPSFENVQQLIEVYRLLGDFEIAVFYAQEYEAEYLSNPDFFEQYIHLLLLDKQYLWVHRLLKKRPNEKLQKDLIQLETTQEFIAEYDLQLKEQLFAQWGQQKQPIFGKKWESWLKGLSLSRFIYLTKKYLPTIENPFLLPKVVEELVSCGVKETLSFKTIDGRLQAVDLSKILPLPQAPQMVLFLELAAEAWENKDPQIAEGIAMEGQAHFSLLYPFLPEVSEIPRWIESYSLEYQSMFGNEKALESLKNYRNIQQTKQKLREIYKELM